MLFKSSFKSPLEQYSMTIKLGSTLITIPTKRTMLMQLTVCNNQIWKKTLKNCYFFFYKQYSKKRLTFWFILKERNNKVVCEEFCRICKIVQKRAKLYTRLVERSEEDSSRLWRNLKLAGFDF